MAVMQDSHERPTAAGHNHVMDDDRARVLALPRAPDAIELRHLRSFVAVAEDGAPRPAKLHRQMAGDRDR